MVRKMRPNFSNWLKDKLLEELIHREQSIYLDFIRRVRNRLSLSSFLNDNDFVLEADAILEKYGEK